jgi:hypothetical protein
MKANHRIKHRFVWFAICVAFSFHSAPAQIPVNPNTGLPVSRSTPRKSPNKNYNNAKGHDWQDFHLDSIVRVPETGDMISPFQTVRLGSPSNMTGIPSDMRKPLFGAIKIGPSASPTIISVAAEDVMDEPRTFMFDKMAKHWTVLFKTKSRLPTKICPLYDSLGQTNITVEVIYGSQSVPLPIQISFQRTTQGAGFNSYMNFNVFLCIARSGQIQLDGKKYNILLVNRDGDFTKGSTLFIDRNHNGNFDCNQEGYFPGWALNIDGKNYVAQVSDVFGASVRIGQTETAAPLNEPNMKVYHLDSH